MSQFVFATARYASGDWESAPSLPEAVIDAVARYTTIDVAPVGVYVDISTHEIFNYPFIWLTGHLPLRFTDAERRNVKQYVERGGLLMIDDHNHDITGVFHKTANEEIERMFGKMTRLPKDHEIYKCFFVFDDGPPNTHHELNGYGDDLLHKYLDAVIVNGRVGLIYSSKDYSSEWNFHADTKKFMQQDPTKFGVNLIVYALTR
ncbi:MAG TPA: DUF4159 domain-containing protein [Gemmatimonadaceae bacterium]|nr:DUF4159 domain-containing protein [Gemmatimonadaceae bacterium]